jgi:hypothetical protein
MCGPSNPPTPPSLPSAPAPMPEMADMGMAPDDDGGSRARRRARVQASGRRSTLMTGPYGVMEQANVGRTTLLGG